MKKTATVGPTTNTAEPGQNEEPANTETVEIPTEQPDEKEVDSEETKEEPAETTSALDGGEDDDDDGGEEEEAGDEEADVAK
jgi:hypothetical protein